MVQASHSTQKACQKVQSWDHPSLADAKKDISDRNAWIQELDIDEPNTAWGAESQVRRQ